VILGFFFDIGVLILRGSLGLVKISLTGCSLSATIIIVLFIVLDEVKALRKDIDKLK
jgi:hypothetical protein